MLLHLWTTLLVCHHFYYIQVYIYVPVIFVVCHVGHTSAWYGELDMVIVPREGTLILKSPMNILNLGRL